MGLLNRLILLNKAEKDPLKTKESFTTLHNYEGRKQEHDQLLREYGFPSEQDESAMRYQRYSEEDSDPKSPDGVTHTRPPWQVAENSEMVAEINDEDAPSFKDSDKAKNRAGENTASIKKSLVQRLIQLHKAGEPEMNYSDANPRSREEEQEEELEKVGDHSSFEMPNFGRGREVEMHPQREVSEALGHTNVTDDGGMPSRWNPNFKERQLPLPMNADRNVKMELMSAGQVHRQQRDMKRRMTSGAQGRFGNR